ncbi:unnamed protein product [Anisakis simplex]|uniref:Peptidase A1 domain-containing protein n=1 Tax=Anisakis simplex TaxID=6269 RepID=A0A0M3K2T0_ANISI|nr:unnamed protein product [Anisakis simplex]
MPEKQPKESKSLYKDKFCKLIVLIFQLGTSQIRVRTYYFPTCQDKIISLDKIVKVYYKKQNLKEDCCRVKQWGMSLTPVWWACDMARGVHRSSANVYNVVIDTGSMICKGFSVTNINTFLSHLEPLIPKDKFVPDQIPS